MAELALLLAPVGREGELERLTLLKPGNQPPKVATGTYQDLTAHPLAGLPAVLQLEAVDAIGQRGQSGPLEIVLPAREFRHPLARAIIERAAQAGGGARNERARWRGSLAALGDTQAAQQLPIAVPLALRAAAARLAMNEGDAASRRSVVDLLWELALFIEDGSLSMAERKLRDLQQELQQALEQGAAGRRARAADGGAAAGDGRVPGGAHPPGDASRASRCRPQAHAAAAGQPDGRPARPAGDARPGARADAQRRARRRARDAGPAPGDAREPARRARSRRSPRRASRRSATCRR